MARVELIRNILAPEKLERWMDPREDLTVLEALPEHLRSIRPEGVVAWVNGTEVPREKWGTTGLRLIDSVRYSLRPNGPGAILALQIVSAIGAAFSLYRSFRTHAPAVESGDEASQTYAWSGIGTSRVEGRPMPLILGRMRVGGQVINEFTISSGVPSETTLYVQYSFGQGPVQSIGKKPADADNLTGQAAPEFLLNENSSDNYDDVVASVRMGTSEQTPIPGFSKTYNWNEVAFDLGAKRTSNKDQSGLYVSGDPYTTDYDAEWIEHGVEVDISDVSDGFRGRVTFPAGLFTIDGSGNIEDAFFRCQIRYRELDATGNPLSTGGPNGDGWVRLAPEAFLSVSEDRAFSRDYEHPFLDPTTWTIPVTGKALHPLTFPGHYAEAALLSDFPAEDGRQVLEWSASVWMKLRAALPTSPSNGDEIQVFGNKVAADNAGFSIGFKYRTNLTGSQSSGWVLQARVLGGSGKVVVAESTDYDARTVFAVGTWYLLSMTYQSGGDGGGKDKLRIFVNDYIEAERAAIQDDRCAFRLSPGTGASNPIRFLRNHDSSAVDYVFADLDDAILIDGYVGLGFVASRFADKGPTYHAELVARWAFDDVHVGGEDTSQEVTFSGAQYFADATLTGCTTGSQNGITKTPPGGTPKRMKARVGFLRLNYDSTNQDVVDDAKLEAVSPYLDAALSYPEEPLLALSILGTGQLNSSRPEMSVEIEGLNEFPVWVSGSAENPAFVYRWTSNPAWQTLGLFTSRKFGVGHLYRMSDMDLESFRAVAERSDEPVYDGSPPDGPDVGTGWVDIIFDATTVGPNPDDPTEVITRGSLKFLYAPASNTVPLHYKRGRYIRPDDVPRIGSGSSINVTGEVGGYEIARDVYWSGANASWVVEAYWDRLGETDPWDTGTHFQTHATPAGSSTGGHRRFECHAVIDTEGDAIQHILSVLAVARATFVREGRRIRLIQDAPLPAGVYADALIGRGDIEDGSWEINYSSPLDEPNLYDFDFLDEDDYHKRKPWPVNAPELDNASAPTADQIRRESGFLWGHTHVAQVERHGLFLCNKNRLQLRSGRFRMTPAGVPLQAGDVAIFAHDILPRGVSGRAAVDPAGGVRYRIAIDSEFELLASTTYYVFARDYLSDAVERCEVDFAQISPGTFPAGTVVPLKNGPHSSGGFTLRPIERLTAYVLTRAGSELRGRVTSATLQEDLTVEVSWVEYRDEIHDDTVGVIEVDSPYYGPSSGGVNRPPEGPSQPSGLPGSDRVDGEREGDTAPVAGPHGLVLRDLVPRARGAGRRPKVRLSWSWWLGEAARVARVRVYARARVGEAQDPDGEPTGTVRSWVLVAEESGAPESVDVELPRWAEAGTPVEFSVQTESRAGTLRRPERCPRAAHVFRGIGPGPRRLSAVHTPTLDGVGIRYSWAIDPAEEDVAVEIRRGGWILGQRVYTGSRGEVASGYVADVASAVTGDPFPLYFAARDAAGQYGPVTRLATFDPSPEVAAQAFPADYVAQAWEEYGDGWVTDSSPPSGDPALSGLQRRSDGALEFAAGLTATYTTFDVSTSPTARRSRQTVRALVEAAVEAEQVHPLTGEAATSSAGDPSFARWTGEGPRFTVGTERNAALRILWRFRRGSSWSAWVDFRPGVYDIIDAQFRVECSRPSTAYQVRVHRFHTRIRRLVERATDRTRASAYLQRESYV